MDIIPAIDIIGGKCVRLTKGDYEQKKVYNEDPLEVAMQFEDAGLNRLHLVDLDGAKTRSVKNWNVLETIASKTNLIIDFGGGVKNEKDVQKIFDCGAAFTTVGSIAIESENEIIQWIKKFGEEKFLLGLDVKDEMITIHGWQKTTSLEIYEGIEKYSRQGIKKIFCTDVSKDGKLEGPSLELYKKIIHRFPHLYLIASGGVSSMNDVRELTRIGCKGVIIGKAIYEKKISLKELGQFLIKN